MTFIRLMDPLDFWIRSDLFEYLILMFFPLAVVCSCVYLLKEIFSI